MNARRIERLRRIGKRLASMSSFRFRLGAVAFKRNKIISMGFNTAKTHPSIAKYFKHATVHAEIDCIHKADPEKIIGASLYVFRGDKKGNPRIARPCPLCVRVMKEAGIRRVYWTTNEFPYWDTQLVDKLFRDYENTAFDLLYETNKWE